ncbi:hypothetical protein [Bradyrhizobium tropiciagri]|uniref:hypothetical protein n=1 Tax=Bradyrhizobium tropiciagri TaxID=312253 RepID=UPI00067B510B|nr:hypothetical protein [Bradyrhizobium tropiciagri]
MRTMTRRGSFILLTGLVTLTSLSQLEARTRVRTAAPATKLTALVVLYDAIPGQEAALERELMTPISQSDIARYGIVNDRVLKNIDPVAAQFASYTKFSGRSNSNDFLSARLDKVKNLVRRAPENHIVKLDSTFTPGHRTDSPTGKEFGYKSVGQTAHLFLGVPAPKFEQDYVNSLAQVKTLTENRSPQGWFGDDLLSSTAPRSAEQLAPYTPRPAASTMMSINYAEYQTFEAAEDAYLNRQQSDDPTFLQLARVFFSSLEVPSRFYIFKVVANR